MGVGPSSVDVGVCLAVWEWEQPKALARIRNSRKRSIMLQCPQNRGFKTEGSWKRLQACEAASRAEDSKGILKDQLRWRNPLFSRLRTRVFLNSWPGSMEGLAPTTTIVEWYYEPLCHTGQRYPISRQITICSTPRYFSLEPVVQHYGFKNIPARIPARVDRGPLIYLAGILAGIYVFETNRQPRRRTLILCCTIVMLAPQRDFHFGIET
jgi:hypothetical protein